MHITIYPVLEIINSTKIILIKSTSKFTFLFYFLIYSHNLKISKKIE